MHATTLPVRPFPIQGAPVLTPRGHAALAVSRLQDQVRALDVEDRDYISQMLADLIVTIAIWR